VFARANFERATHANLSILRVWPQIYIFERTAIDGQRMRTSCAAVVVVGVAVAVVVVVVVVVVEL
jgi:hypothetical protein